MVEIKTVLAGGVAWVEFEGHIIRADRIQRISVYPGDKTYIYIDNISQCCVDLPYAQVRDAVFRALKQQWDFTS